MVDSPKRKRFCSASKVCCASDRVATAVSYRARACCTLNHRVLHVDAYLAHRLLILQLALPQLELIGHVIGLGHAIPKWNVQRKSGRVVGKIAAENLPQQVAVAADISREAARSR